MKSLYRIRLVFLAAVLVSLLPFLGNRVWLIRADLEQRMASIGHSVEASISRANRQFAEAKADVNSVMTTIYMMPALTSIASTACNRMLVDLVENQTKIEQISLIYPSGTVFCSSDPVALGFSEADQDYFKRALGSRETQWTDFVFSHLNGRPTLLASRTVYRESAVEYVLSVAINLTTLRQSVLDQFDLPVAQTALIDQDGIFLFRDAFLSGMPLFQSETIQKIKSMDAGVITPDTYGAGQNVIGVTRLEGTTAHLAVAVAVADVFAAANRDLMLSMLVIGAEGLIIVILVMLGLEWLILRVLRHVIDVAARITTGDLSSRIEIRTVLPELASLSTSINQMVESLEQAALADGMTGLPNRRALDLNMDRAIRRQKRYGDAFTVVMIDIDCFKPFNDRYGHGVGDQVLCLVGQTISRFARRTDELVARYGGEEFTMILTETAAEQVFTHLDNAREAVQHLGVPHEDSPYGVVTISIGYAVFRNGDTAQSVLARADRALYRAKQSGRNNVQFDSGIGRLPDEAAPALLDAKQDDGVAG